MKKILLLLLVVIFIGGSYLWIEGRDLHEIRTEIDIAAPPEKVWAIITDIDSWGEWSPIINSAEGNAELNATLTITMISKKAGKDGPVYQPEITHFDAPNYFHWRAVMFSEVIMTNDKVFELEKTETGTRLVHKELFKGMMLPIFCNKFDENVPAMLNSMNQALKELAEK